MTNEKRKKVRRHPAQKVTFGAKIKKSYRHKAEMHVAGSLRTRVGYSYSIKIIAGTHKGSGSSPREREMMTVFHEQSPSTLNAVADILSQAPSIKACYLRPHPTCCIFVSWNGCIVLVFDGFPPPLVQAKTRIENNSARLHLKEENFGSKWPKTTLGAVLDGADELSPEQFKTLKNICHKYSKKIIGDQPVSLDNGPASHGIKIATLSLVEYRQRGLEGLCEQIDVSLDDFTTNNYSHSDDVKEDSITSTPSEEEKSRVNSVISEWNNEEAYLPKVNAPGSRINSYRQVCNGCSCVAFIHSTLPKHIRSLLSEFRDAVDQAFPGRYGWLDETSLHCTLRSLDGPAKQKNET